MGAKSILGQILWAGFRYKVGKKRDQNQVLENLWSV